MKCPLSNYMEFSRLEPFHQLRNENVLIFVRPTGCWIDLWTNVYVKEIFSQVGRVPKWKDKSGRYKYKWTDLGQSTVSQSWFQTSLPILANSIKGWGSIHLLYIALTEFKFRRRIFFDWFWSAVSLQPLLPQAPGKWPEILIWLLFCGICLCITEMWKGYHFNDIMHIFITG